MMKSYQQSNGRTLNMNWEEVSQRDFYDDADDELSAKKEAERKKKEEEERKKKEEERRLKAERLARGGKGGDSDSEGDGSEKKKPKDKKKPLNMDDCPFKDTKPITDDVD